MTGRRLALLAVLAAVPIACLTTVAGCQSGAACGWIPTQGTSWWPAAYVPPLLVVLASALAWTLKFGLVASRTERELARLPRVPFPPKLVRTARAAGLDRFECVRAGSPMAFCAGIVRPTVFISKGAGEGLSGSAPLGVLPPEREHTRRKEPLWRAARIGARPCLT